MTVTLSARKGENFVTGSVTATDEAITLASIKTRGDVSIQITGTFTGTITFEVTTDGTNWSAFNMTPSNSGTDASTATAVGQFSKSIGGYAGVRARFSTASSGSPVITIRNNPSSK